MMSTFEWLQAGVFVLGLSVAIVRNEHNARANSERLGEIKTDLSQQHIELRDEIRVLFGHTREHEATIRELKVRTEEHSKRLDEQRSHIDKIGGEIGVGRTVGA